MMARFAVLLALLSSPAAAWEAGTTHAGLTEQAALSSRLHRVLSQRHGLELGLYEPAGVAPASAPELYHKLARLEPSSGYVPDVRGRQSALAWLVAGTILEDVPGERAVNHFYDPARKVGLTGRAKKGLLLALRAAGKPRGLPAPEWIHAPANDLGVARFWLELEQSVIATGANERSAHLAYALLCAGAMLHVLEDVASPSRARDDYGEHLQELGAGPSDLGSRFERLAALAYDRLGVPAPATIERRASARAFFSSDDGRGLADWAAHFYSSGTLPEGPLGEKRVLRDDDGTCLARSDDGETWFIPDDCAAGQLAAILPVAGAYATGFLDWLFRGALDVTVDGRDVTVKIVDLGAGAGTLRVLSEDEKGERRELRAAKLVGAHDAGATLISFRLDEGAAPARVVAVFRGVDATGEEVVAVGTASR